MRKILKRLKQAYQDGRSTALEEKVHSRDYYFTLNILAQTPNLSATSQAQIISDLTESSLDFNRRINQLRNKKRNPLESLAYGIGYKLNK